MTQDITTLSTLELVSLFNETFNKSIKVGSYTRAKMIADLEAVLAADEAAGEETLPHEPTEEPGADFGDMTGGYYPTPTGAETPSVVGDRVLTQEEMDAAADAILDAIDDQKALEDAGHDPVVDAIDPEAMLDEGRCPICGGDAEAQTSAGEEGSFLAACNTCGTCGKTYSCVTGEAVEVAKPGGGKKRKILNPQPKIDAKGDALSKIGFTQSYDRVTRLWTITDKATGISATLSSPDYSVLGPKDMEFMASEMKKVDTKPE